MTRDERHGLLIALAVMVLFTLFATAATAQNFVPSDMHPNFSSKTRQYLSASNDCAVIAYAIAADVPYHRAHRLFAATCRATAQDATDIACMTKNWPYYMQNSNRTYLWQSYVDIPCTVAEFARANTDGNFFLIVPGHALAVCDGTVYDNLSNIKMDAEVLGAILVIDPLD
jgi:hypothetical protein